MFDEDEADFDAQKYFGPHHNKKCNSNAWRQILYGRQMHMCRCSLLSYCRNPITGNHTLLGCGYFFEKGMARLPNNFSVKTWGPETHNKLRAFASEL